MAATAVIALFIALVPATFAARHGWHAGHSRVGACPGVSATRCEEVTSWSSNVPWRGCGDCLPHKMIEALPHYGIALQVQLSVEHPARSKPSASWPPVIRSRDVVGGFEGVPARFGVFQRSLRVRQTDVYVWAFFGTAHPSPKQLAAANAELHTIQLP